MALPPGSNRRNQNTNTRILSKRSFAPAPDAAEASIVAKRYSNNIAMDISIQAIISLLQEGNEDGAVDYRRARRRAHAAFREVRDLDRVREREARAQQRAQFQCVRTFARRHVRWVKALREGAITDPRSPLRPHERYLLLVIHGVYLCSECHRILPSTQFERKQTYVAPQVPARSSRCARCSGAHIRTNPEKSHRLRSLAGARRRAVLAKTEAKREFTLTKEWLDKTFEAQGGLCCLSGVPLTHHMHSPSTNGFARMHPDNLSIDRRDSQRGYTEDNAQLCTSFVNQCKNDSDEHQFINMCVNVALHSGHKVGRPVVLRHTPKPC